MSFDRGAEWHRWDPHIHAPGTLREDRYAGDWAGYIAEIENAAFIVLRKGLQTEIRYEARDERLCAGPKPCRAQVGVHPALRQGHG